MSHILDESALLSETVRQNVINGITGYRSNERFHLESLDTRQLANEALRRRVHWIARPVSDWVHVRRATFFPESESANPVQRVLTSERFIPRLSFVAESVQDGINKAGEQLQIAQLAEFTINRIGINYMHGRRNRISEIPTHTDVATESGAVVILRLSEGPSTSIVDNNTQIIFCKDVCDLLQVEQYEHGISSNLLRVSATFANLKT